MPPVLSAERIAHLGTARACCAADFTPAYDRARSGAVVEGGTQLYPLCYGSSEISLRNSDSGQARTVRVRTFPSEPSASANFATLSPLGVSTMRRRSSSPEVR